MEPKAHIYACDKAAVYGDVEVVLGPDMKIQKVEDVENEFHFLVICKQYVKLRSVLYSHLSCPEFDQLNDQNKFCYMLTHTPVARLVGQFIIDAFDDRPVKT